MAEFKRIQIDQDRRLLLRRAKAQRQEESLRATADAMEQEYRKISSQAENRMLTRAAVQLEQFRAEHLK